MLPQPASAAATDPTLTKLKNAADAARVFGFQDLRNQAEGKLAQGLRFVTDRALATALAAPAGSAAEGVAKQQAREVIQQGQVWVTTIVPGVARVDPSLPGYLVDALERLNCSGPFEVVVLANTTVKCAGVRRHARRRLRCAVSIRRQSCPGRRHVQARQRSIVQGRCESTFDLSGPRRLAFRAATGLPPPSLTSTI